MSKRRNLNRSMPAVLAATVLIAVVMGGCSSASTRAPETIETGATSTTSSTATAVSSPTEGTPPENAYFLPTADSLGDLVEFVGDGPFVMLNLFRLKDVPDFSRHPELKPDTPMTTHELFYRYVAHMDTLLDKVGAKRIYLADSGPMLIGAPGEQWDVVQMVQYPSKQSFIDLAALVRPEVSDREVMLADSRVMPMHEKALDAPFRAD